MRENLQMKFATVAILLVLGLQSAAVVLMAGPSGWPFTDYPMYSWVHREGERLTGARYVVFAIASDGKEIEILPEDVGVNRWVYQRWAGPLFKKWAIRPASRPRGSDAISEPHRPEPAESVNSNGSLGSLREALKSSRSWVKSLSENRAYKTNKGGAENQENINSLFLAMLEKKLHIDIVRLRIEATSFVITRDGMVPAPSRAALVNVDSYK